MLFTKSERYALNRVESLPPKRSNFFFADFSNFSSTVMFTRIFLFMEISVYFSIKIFLWR